MRCSATDSSVSQFQRQEIIVARNSRQTGSKAAKAASKVLRGNYSKAAKTAAASALSQKGKGR